MGLVERPESIDGGDVPRFFFAVGYRLLLLREARRCGNLFPLAPLAELLTLEFTKAEAGRELGKASSTVMSRTDKLKDLLTAFLETIETP